MSQNQEQIEARLCDYVEGTLDELQRAEIEKHLAANPGHRKLIGELQRTREMVRKLPRVTAPGDVSETLQGQLERSVLLGALPDDLPTPRLQIGGWARWGTFAAAAVLMLALSGTIYLVLRSPGTSFEIASMSKPNPAVGDGFGTIAGIPATGPSTDSELAAAGPALGESVRGGNRLEPESAPHSAVATAAPSPSAVLPAPAPVPGAVASNAFENTPGTSAGASGGRADVAADAMFGTHVRDRGQPSMGEPFVCVADPSLTDRQVMAYLDNNKIAYRIEPMPPPLEGDADKQAIFSRAAQNAVNLKMQSIEAPAARQKSERLFAPGTQPVDAKEQVAQAAGNSPTTPPGQMIPQDALARQPAMIRARNLTRQQEMDLRANLSKAVNQQTAPAELLGAKSIHEEKDALGKLTNVPGAAPATQPVAIDEARSEISPSKPLLADTLDAFPATAPATTQPAGEQHVDLVILVCPPEPGAQPATQPAAPATQPETAVPSDSQK